MAALNLATFAAHQHTITDEPRMAEEIATTPRGITGAARTGTRMPLLTNIRELLRIDLSASDMSPDDPLFRSCLQGVLAYHREMAAKLDRLLQVTDPLQRTRLRKLVGPREEIKSVLEALEDTIEDLEIATNPEAHAAIKQLIDEAKAP
jgi:hypothetical protein